MRAARVAALVLLLATLPGTASAGPASLSNLRAAGAVHIPAGSVWGTAGPARIAAGTIVVEGTLRGDSVTLRAADSIVVRGRVIARSGDVTLAAPSVVVERDGLVASGTGRDGATARGAVAAGSRGENGGDITIDARHFIARGTLRLGDGGRGGDAAGMLARGGRGGNGGVLTGTAGLRATGTRIEGGRGGDGGDAIALPRAAARQTAHACAPAPAGSTGKAGNTPKAAKPAATIGDGSDGSGVTTGGGDGLAGARGSNGTGGAPGAFGVVAASDGAPGSDGCEGHRGGDGGTAQALGGDGGDSSAGAGGDGGDAVATGGRGGKGGQGGTGGTGGRGGPAAIALGGDGGPGGDGARGGVGGDGGDACAQGGSAGVGAAGDGTAGSAQATPGSAGAAGDGGAAGAGGPGGTSLGSLTNGATGAPGGPGPVGAPGVPGEVLAAPCIAAVQVSADPYSGGEGQHATEVEPDSLAYGSTMVTAFQVSRIFDGGAMNVGWATSNDNGASWTSGMLPAITTVAGGPWARASDPVVAYSARDGVWMIQTLGISTSGGVAGRVVLVSRSTDGGRTWGAPVTVAGGPSANLDKNWMVCDNTPASPYYGNCYSTWDDHGAGNRMEMNTSSDGGLTWGPVLRPADNAGGLGGVPVVQPDGTVVVPYQTGWSQARAFRSTNGGASWSASTLISTVSYHSPAGSLRSPPLPSAEVAADGTIYLAWMDCRFRSGCAANDIVYATSTDGTAWSAPVRIPIDPADSGIDHFLPGIAVDATTSGATTRLFVAYYSYPQTACGSSCALQTGYVFSSDNGATWSPATVGEPFPVVWSPNTTQGRMVGDYISASFVEDGRALPIWARGYAPQAGVLDLGMETIMGGIDVTAPGALRVPAASDPVLAGVPARPAATTLR